MKRLNLKSICWLLNALTSLAFSAAARAESGNDQPSPTGMPERISNDSGWTLSEQCNRLLIKTLRGWLVSIPVSRSEPNPSLCAGAVSANLH